MVKRSWAWAGQPGTVSAAFTPSRQPCHGTRACARGTHSAIAASNPCGAATQPAAPRAAPGFAAGRRLTSSWSTCCGCAMTWAAPHHRCGSTRHCGRGILDGDRCTRCAHGGVHESASCLRGHAQGPCCVPACGLWHVLVPCGVILRHASPPSLLLSVRDLRNSQPWHDGLHAGRRGRHGR